MMKEKLATENSDIAQYFQNTASSLVGGSFTYSGTQKQAGTGPSRRHIQGSKIAKRLPSVEYSFTVLENRKFLKKIFSKKLHTQKN